MSQKRSRSIKKSKKVKRLYLVLAHRSCDHFMPQTSFCQHNEKVMKFESYFIVQVMILMDKKLVGKPRT